MISFPRLILNVSLMNLFILSPASPQTTAPAKPPASAPGIKIERRTPDEGMIITRYQDLRSGRMVIVKGGTEPGTARLWLASLNEMKADIEASYVAQMTKMVNTYKPSGMLGLAIPSQGIQLSVFSGALPGGIEAINVNAQDIRSGTSVNLAENAKQEDGLAWLETAKDADNEAGFAALIGANRTKGLIGVSGVWNGIRVETLWQRK
jgi:hypothetical protein